MTGEFPAQRASIMEKVPFDDAIMGVGLFCPGTCALPPPICISVNDQLSLQPGNHPM